MTSPGSPRFSRETGSVTWSGSGREARSVCGSDSATTLALSATWNSNMCILSPTLSPVLSPTLDASNPILREKSLILI